MSVLSRRAILALPLILAACGDDESQDRANRFPPLRYDYLPPIQLNVASIEIQQRFIPAGVPPDVSASDPIQPTDVLKTMANDRLQALGTTNKAVFAILDATLSKTGDVISGVMSVSLTIYDADNVQRGDIVANVQRTHTGEDDNLRRTLYDMTKDMMNAMNVEFEYQIRQHLKEWLATSTAPDTPVEQTPLTGPPS
ncbi:MAG TPA: hypothetical protein VHB27_16940 [Rhodopila sp.]|uniref:hypothetical protein n=1 Tax=Rhodopila sp. TaxID=2480087 RepID=UPI002B611AE8|nr:hypothetical protein [Rhodopila sp.]HVY16911.1 hypothetical protein [Rhodopila sp.]